MCALVNLLDIMYCTVEQTSDAERLLVLLVLVSNPLESIILRPHAMLCHGMVSGVIAKIKLHLDAVCLPSFLPSFLYLPRWAPLLSLGQGMRRQTYVLIYAPMYSTYVVRTTVGRRKKGYRFKQVGNGVHNKFYCTNTLPCILCNIQYYE